MAWPEDPYGTGQLWRAEPPLLASFAACCVDDDERAVPVSYAAVYLRLHRTTPVDATAGFAFGFRAVSATSEDDLSELVRLFDLDVMRARRLAKVVAGYRLADDVNRSTPGTRTGTTARGLGLPFAEGAIPLPAPVLRDVVGGDADRRGPVDGEQVRAVLGVPSGRFDLGFVRKNVGDPIGRQVKVDVLRAAQ